MSGCDAEADNGVHIIDEEELERADSAGPESPSQAPSSSSSSSLSNLSEEEVKKKQSSSFKHNYGTRFGQAMSTTFNSLLASHPSLVFDYVKKLVMELEDQAKEAFIADMLQKKGKKREEISKTDLDDVAENVKRKYAVRTAVCPIYVGL